MMAKTSHRPAGAYLTTLVVITRTAMVVLVAVVAAVFVVQVKGDVCKCPKGFVNRYIPTLFCRCQCYKFVRDLASWAEAKVYCNAMGAFTKEELGISVKDAGADLAEVGDKNEEKWLKQQLRRKEGQLSRDLLGKADYWLGAHDLQVNKKWKWAASHEYVKYVDWLPRQPNYSGNRKCLSLGPGRAALRHNYGWFNDACCQKKFYICEKRGWCIK